MPIVLLTSTKLLALDFIGAAVFSTEKICEAFREVSRDELALLTSIQSNCFGFLGLEKPNSIYLTAF